MRCNSLSCENWVPLVEKALKRQRQSPDCARAVPLARPPPPRLGGNRFTSLAKCRVATNTVTLRFKRQGSPRIARDDNNRTSHGHV